MADVSQTVPGRVRARTAALVFGSGAVLACLTPFLLNGTPLVYYDSLEYIDGGLRLLGDHPILPKGTPDVGPGLLKEGRSVQYQVATAVLWAWRSIDLMLLVNLAAVAFSFWIPLRVAAREHGSPVGGAAALPMILLAAACGSLPFYVSFLMPDIFAAVLILCLCALAVFGRQMRLWEVACLTALAWLSMVLHPSHLLIGLAMLPVVILAAVLAGPSRRWLGPVAATVALGLSVAGMVMPPGSEPEPVETPPPGGAEPPPTRYTPFLTARILTDGPGMRLLEATCDTQPRPTCALYDALQEPSDLGRLHATRIVFSNDPDTGSFRLLDAAVQKEISDEQVRFYIDAALSEPLTMTRAYLLNTLRQLREFTIYQTIPMDTFDEVIDRKWPVPAADLRMGALSVDRDWIGPVNIAHALVYAVSALAIAAGLLRRDGLPAQMRLFALAIGLGILANAFICGSVSQPAARYGARVIWLLPALAAFLWLFASRGRARAVAS